MGLFSKRPPEVKQSAVHGSETLMVGLGTARWSQRSYRSLADEGYRRNVVAHRAVRLISESAAAVPIILHRGDQRLQAHTLLDLIKRPNPVQGRCGFFENAYAYLNIAGNSYLEMVKGPDGTPAELYTLRPDRMKLAAGRGAWPSAYIYGLEGREHRFPVDGLTGESAILHLKTFNPLDDHYGLSPLEAAAYGIDIHNAASNWNKALLDNAARPSGALTFEPKDGSSTLSTEQFNRLKSEMEDNFQGPTNAGRPLLLEGGLKWQQMAFSPADMDFINGKHAAARDIALAFGVPPQLLSIPGDNSYSNYREANRALWRTTILPLMDKIISELNMWLVPHFGSDLRLSHDLEAVPALASDREALWNRIGGADFMTLNEKRAALGLGAVEGGDVFS